MGKVINKALPIILVKVDTNVGHERIHDQYKRTIEKTTLSSWYIFRIFQIFSTLIILTFYAFSTMFYVTFLMIFLNLYGHFYHLILFGNLIALIRSHILFPYPQ